RLLFRSAALATLLIPTCALALNRPQIQARRDGDGIQLIWSGGILQTAPAVTGPWVPVPGATSPHKVPTPQGMALFRVQQAYQVTVSKAGAGSGTVRSMPEGIG